MRLSTIEQWRARIPKNLVIVMEYAPPEIYPTNLQSGLKFFQNRELGKDLGEEVKDHVGKSSPSTNTKLALKKFVHKDLVRLDNGGYEFLPWNTSFPSLFECVQSLSTLYFYSEIFNHLSWQEYEILITQALNQVGYQAFRTFRFKSPSQRYEIDCVARSIHQVLFIDAKRWKNATTSQTGLIQAIKQQHKRVSTLITMPEQLISCGSIFKPDPRIFKLKLYILVLVASDMPKNIIIPEGVALPFARFNHFLTNFHEFTAILSPIEYCFPESTRMKQNQLEST